MVQQVILAADVEVMSEQGDKHREAVSCSLHKIWTC